LAQHGESDPPQKGQSKDETNLHLVRLHFLEVAQIEVVWRFAQLEKENP
jgi:hypothetical protein